MSWTMWVIAGFMLLGSNHLLSAQTKTAPPAMPGELVDAGGYRVHIYCTGQGNPTVVVASGGFSFDWGLVQPEIAQTTRVCTYDPAGMAWSDPLPQHTKPDCAGRVIELHNLLKNASVRGPYILLGFSIGGLVARLYAARYPDEVSGLVLVDHAFIDTQKKMESAAPGPIAAARLDSPPVPISKTPIDLDLIDDENFGKLPERDQELHRWAVSIHSFRPGPEMAAACFSEVAEAERRLPAPRGNKPVAVVSTLYDSPRYRELQHELLALSRNSKQWIADNSSHMVIIDQPGVVVRAIRDVVASAASGAKL